jgi:EmrB/QacA subfamily drug resistance transporter
MTSTPAALDRPASAADRRYSALISVCMSLLVVTVDNTLMNVTLPTLMRVMRATNAEAQWIVNAYTLSFASLLLPAGGLSDRHGHRRMLLIGLGVLGLGALLAGSTATPAWLIAMRALMGLGAALMMPATLSIIVHVFPAHERTKAIALWGATSGIGVALGPVLGGLLLAHHAWRAVFFVHVPIVLLAWPMVRWGVPTIPVQSARPGAPDWFGALLAMLGLCALTYGVIEAPCWPALALAVLCLAGFALWQRRVTRPLLDMRLLRAPGFAAASCAIAAMFFGLFGAVFVFTQYTQLVLRLSALEAGLGLLPLAGALLVVAPVGALLASRFGERVVVTVGLLVLASGLASAARCGLEPDSGAILSTMLLLATGMGLGMPAATGSIMASLPAAQSGIGSAVNDATRELGGALGVAIVGSVFARSYAAQLAGSHGLAGLPEATRVRLAQSLGSALAVAHDIGGREGLAIAHATRAAFVSAMHQGSYVAAAVVLLAALVSACWFPARQQPQPRCSHPHPASPPRP